jgi:hypothetical protein
MGKVTGFTFVWGTMIHPTTLSSMTIFQYQSEAKQKSGVGVHACNFSTWEAQAGRS